MRETWLQLDLVLTPLNSNDAAPCHSEGSRDNSSKMSNVITSSDAAMRHFPEDGIRTPAARLAACNQKPPSLSLHLS